MRKEMKKNKISEIFETKKKKKKKKKLNIVM